MFDLVIRGGNVVTSGTTALTDIGIHKEKITQIGGPMTGRRELDARGMYITPGGVDVHVHLTYYLKPEPGAELLVDDFYSGSKAAIAGGITTIGNMTHPWAGETLLRALQRDMAAAKRDAAVDFILHPVMDPATPETLAEVKQLASEGHNSLKIFTLFEDFDSNVDYYIDAFRIAAASGLLVMVHCEDGPLIRSISRELVARGQGSAAYYPQSRPDFVEAIATERAIAFTRATGAPIYVVHLSSAAALDRCRRARIDGLPVYVETRPLYLYLTRDRFEEPNGAKYTGNPPLREHKDLLAMWRGLANGDIHCLCSDHAPWTLAQKLDPTLDITTLPIRAGVSDLETLMPMLFSEGVRTGRISLNRFVEITSTNAARLFGMYPQKGTIAVNSDADIVVWDPQLRQTIEGSTMYSNAGYSVYDGWEVHGGPAYTISRGEIVFESGEVKAERGRGRQVHRGKGERL